MREGNTVAGAEDCGSSWGREACEFREFGKGGVSGTCDASMSFDMLRATGSLSSLLSVLRGTAPFGRGEPVSQVLRNAGFYVTTRNPFVQVDPIPGSLDWGLGDWSFFWL